MAVKTSISKDSIRETGSSEFIHVGGTVNDEIMKIIINTYRTAELAIYPFYLFKALTADFASRGSNWVELLAQGKKQKHS